MLAADPCTIWTKHNSPATAILDLHKKQVCQIYMEDELR